MPAIAERLPAKYLVKTEAPKIIASREQHEAYIQRLLELQRKARRTVEETETAKLLKDAACCAPSRRDRSVHHSFFLCHPDRSGLALSCVRFSHAGPRSGGTLA